MDETLGLIYSCDEKNLKLLKEKYSDNFVKKCLLHIRSVPNGLGNKRGYLYLIQRLLENEDYDYDLVDEIIRDPRFTREGCWNDLNDLWEMKLSKRLHHTIVRTFANQLITDCLTEEGKPISNCAKWIPTEKSKKNTHGIVNRLCKTLGEMWKRVEKNPLPFPVDGTKQSFRRVVSHLRERLKVTERLMSLKRPEDICFITKAQSKKYRYYFRDYSIDRGIERHPIEKDWWDLIDKKVVEMVENDVKEVPMVISEELEYEPYVQLYYATIQAILTSSWRNKKLEAKVYFKTKRMLNSITIVIAEEDEDGFIIRRSFFNIFDQMFDNLTTLDTVDLHYLDGKTIFLLGVVSVPIFEDSIVWKWRKSEIQEITNEVVYGYYKQMIRSVINFEKMDSKSFLQRLMDVEF